jgi:formate/nitrite transporter
VQDVGVPGGVERVASRRASGIWATAKWLIEKSHAHIDEGRLVLDSTKAKKPFKNLGSVPLHVDGDRFRAKPRRDIPGEEESTPAMRRAQRPTSGRLRRRCALAGKSPDDPQASFRGIPALLAKEEPEDRPTPEPWDFSHAGGSRTPRARGPILQAALSTEMDACSNRPDAMMASARIPANNFCVDVLLPAEMAVACEAAGTAKAGRDWVALVVLGVLAGAFIAFGAMFMTVVTTGAGDLPWGLGRLVAGLAFSLGLILVIVGGAELFTGDSLMIVAWASRSITIGSLLRAWLLVYAGNIAGAIGTAALVFFAAQYEFAGGAVGQTALAIASAKAALPTVPLFLLAVLCNVLVCLAVWMSFGARSAADKVVVIVPPVAAFVAAGFEHSIANLYFLPLALAIKAWAGPGFWAGIGQSVLDFPDLTIASSLHNIVVATAGNLVGGSLMVGAVYWFVYLRRRPD